MSQRLSFTASEIDEAIRHVRKEIDNTNLYLLTPAEFEKLCAQILRSKGWRGVELIGGPHDQGVDIVGKVDGLRCAVQVKHTKQISRHSIEQIINQMIVSAYDPEHLVVMTSACITQPQREEFQKLSNGRKLTFIDHDEIVGILSETPDIQRTQIESARRRTVRQKRELILGAMGVATSLVGLALSLVMIFNRPEKPGLQKRIETVEVAIGNLKDLEGQLNSIKTDMVKTEEEARLIKQEYEQAKALEKFTDEQYRAARSALSAHSWKTTALNYVLGFILGIASSLIASVIHSKLQQQKALQEN